MTHPNLVTVYDAAEAGSVHYFSMQFLEGINLQKLVQDSGPLPVSLACDLIRQAALGLQHAYEQGLVHRDVKPANLMVTPRPDYQPDQPWQPPPEGVTLRVLDLGLARLRERLGPDDGSHSALTEPGAVIGTVDYIAPEQARDPRAADIRADLYSLGCTFYFLLTGRLPFPGGTLLDKLDRHRWEEPTRVQRHRVDVPMEIGNVVRKLMAKRPEDRIQTPIELAAALATVRIGGDSGFGSSSTLVVADPGETMTVSPSGDARPEPLPEEGYEFARLKTLLAEALVQGAFPHARTLVAKMLSLRPDDWDALAARAAIERYNAAESSDEIACFSFEQSTPSCLALAPDDRFLMVGSTDGKLRTVDLQAFRDNQPWQAHRGAVTTVALAQHGRLLLSAGEDDALRSWDPLTGQQVFEITQHVADVRQIIVQDADGLFVTCAGRPNVAKESLLRTWELATRKELRTLRGHRSRVNAACFLGKEGKLLSASDDGMLRLWDVRNGKSLQALAGNAGPITAMTCLPDHQKLLYLGDSVRLFDLPSAGALTVLYPHDHPVQCLALAPDGQRFVTGDEVGTVHLWDVASGRLGRQQVQRVLGIETSVRTWEPMQGSPPCTYRGHQAGVTAIAIAHSGQFFVTCSQDRTCRVWSLPEYGT